ncbi:hypothetical protein L1887_12460 [Cichorium endivia]|nr:hypothetical protein L1887_12460 [Cichorium endivia]
MESILEELKVKEHEFEDVEQLHQTLIVKERLSNDELQKARKELISALKESHSGSIIGVKSLGELDEKPFLKDANGVCLLSLWENRLRDPSWHPFKVITIEGETKEVVDEEDEKLACLKAGHDDDVYNAVVTALKELNYYNPRGRCPLMELWNNKDNRKATLKEVIHFILGQMISQ